MAKTKQEKQDIVKDFTEKVKNSKSLVFANFAGLSVKETEELRKKCRTENVGYMVAKKTLMKIAFKEADIKDVDPKTFDNSIATVFGFEDEVAPARIVQEFSKEHEALQAFGGILEGLFVDQAKVIELSKLPSKEQLLAMVVGSIKAPVSGFVNVLSGNLRNLVYVLSAVKESKS